MLQTQYKLQSPVFMLDMSDRTYILKIRDLPPEEKPRERLASQGPTALSTQELLAVILGSGTKKEELLTMTSRIMKEYGEKSIINQTDPIKLAHDLDIPINKASQIVACGELGRRFFSRKENAIPTIRNAREVFEYTHDMRSLSKEYLRGLYLNSHYKVIHDEVISIGTIDTSIIHPREVFRPAIEYSATALILVHNHPSGSPEPSVSDITTTQQLKEAGTVLGIDLIDHVIVTKNSFKSILS